MTQSKLALLVLPSWVSFGFTLLASGALLSAANWAYVTASPWLYDTFYGEHGIVTTLERSPNAVAAVQDGIANNTVVYVVALCLIALLSAAAVFVIIHSVKHGLEVLRAVRSGSSFEHHEQLQRATVRAAVVVLWSLYVLATVNILVPFGLLQFRIGVEEMGGMPGILLGVGASALLFIVIHVHVIFVRLFCLRPRLYGGDSLSD